MIILWYKYSEGLINFCMQKFMLLPGLVFFLVILVFVSIIFPGRNVYVGLPSEPSDHNMEGDMLSLLFMCKSSDNGLKHWSRG